MPTVALPGLTGTRWDSVIACAGWRRRTKKATVMDISDRTRQQRINSIVREFIKTEPNDRAITPDESLANLGLTSVDTVNLMLAIEAEFDLTIPGMKLIPANLESAPDALSGSYQNFRLRARRSARLAHSLAGNPEGHLGKDHGGA